LPTNGYARAYSGVNLDSFVKKITFQEISKKGIWNLSETIQIMAEYESLQAHKNAVSLRIESFASALYIPYAISLGIIDYGSWNSAFRNDEENISEETKYFITLHHIKN